MCVKRRAGVVIVGLIAFAAIFLGSGTAQAVRGIIDGPILVDPFPSRASLEVLLGDPSKDPPQRIKLVGPTVIHREKNAEPSGPAVTDTVDTEIVSMHLKGSVGPLQIELKAGEDSGFLPGLNKSGGRIEEDSSATENDAIDIPPPIPPANSFFDVFFDVWVDQDFGNDVDVGEVFRPANALRMENQQPLQQLPPQPGVDYVSTGMVEPDDPDLYLFDANVLSGDLALFPVQNDGSLGTTAAGFLPNTEDGTHVHTVLPEPTTITLTGLALVGLLVVFQVRRRRSRRS